MGETGDAVGPVRSGGAVACKAALATRIANGADTYHVTQASGRGERLPQRAVAACCDDGNAHALQILNGGFEAGAGAVAPLIGGHIAEAQIDGRDARRTLSIQLEYLFEGLNYDAVIGGLVGVIHLDRDDLSTRCDAGAAIGRSASCNPRNLSALRIACAAHAGVGSTGGLCGNGQAFGTAIEADFPSDFAAQKTMVLIDTAIDHSNCLPIPRGRTWGQDGIDELEIVRLRRRHGGQRCNGTCLQLYFAVGDNCECQRIGSQPVDFLGGCPERDKGQSFKASVLPGVPAVGSVIAGAEACGRCGDLIVLESGVRRRKLSLRAKGTRRPTIIATVPDCSALLRRASSSGLIADAAPGVAAEFEAANLLSGPIS